MGFLDNAKRHAARLRRDSPTTEADIAAAAHRVEPQIDYAGGLPSGPVDPEIRRMAQAFEALYSYPQSPTDRHALGRTDSDDFFADTAFEPSLNAAPGDAASLRRESPDAERKTPAIRRDLAPPAESLDASPKKTSIEMVFDMRRTAEEKANRMAAPLPRAVPQPVSAPEAPFGAAPGGRDARPWSPPAREQPVDATEWSSRHRRVHIRLLAGAALTLLIGTGLGYLLGKGEPTTANAVVGSSNSGVKLRLDPDLRQQ